MAGKKLSERLTDAQREEIAHKYIDSIADPYAVPVTQEELAEEYGVSRRTVGYVLQDSKVLERVRRRTRSDAIVAQAIAERAAVQIMRETVRSAFKIRDEKYEYINQGDRRDILDRAGVRVEKKEAADVTVTFKSGIGLGMPGDDE